MAVTRSTSRITLTLVVTLALVVGITTTVLAGSPRSNPPLDTDGPINTITAWTHAFDADDLEGAMEVFTRDATFLFYLSPDADPLVFEGRDAISELFGGSIEAQVPGEVRRHVTTNHLVERISRKRVEVRSYLTLLQSVTGVSEDPAVIASGVYTDTLVRTRWGTWKIERRELVLDTPTADDADASDALSAL